MKDPCEDKAHVVTGNRLRKPKKDEAQNKRKAESLRRPSIEPSSTHLER